MNGHIRPNRQQQIRGILQQRIEIAADLFGFTIETRVKRCGILERQIHLRLADGLSKQVGERLEQPKLIFGIVTIVWPAYAQHAKPFLADNQRDIGRSMLEEMVLDTILFEHLLSLALAEHAQPPFAQNIARDTIERRA